MLRSAHRVAYVDEGPSNVLKPFALNGLLGEFYRAQKTPKGIVERNLPLVSNDSRLRHHLVAKLSRIAPMFNPFSFSAMPSCCPTSSLTQRSSLSGGIKWVASPANMQSAALSRTPGHSNVINSISMKKRESVNVNRPHPRISSPKTCMPHRSGKRSSWCLVAKDKAPVKAM